MSRLSVFTPRHQPARVLPGFEITLGFTIAYLTANIRNIFNKLNSPER
jgi:hypothetical protein